MTVISLHYPFSSVEYQWNGVKVIPLNGRNNRLKRLFLLKRKFFKTIQKLHFKQPIDVLHSFWLNECTFFASVFSKQQNLPLITTAMGQDVKSSNPWLKKIAFDSLKLIALTPFQQQHLQAIHIQTDEIIPWGVNDVVHVDKTIDLIGVGNLTPLKQYDYFIQLVESIVIKGINVKAKIIGKGSEYERLKKMIEVKHLSNNIELVGELDYYQTQLQIAQAKIMVHPSSFEGFGMIFIEAKASQTYVTSYPVGYMYSKKGNFLTGTIEQDTNQLIHLLKAPLPQKEVNTIQATVDYYCKIYEV